MADTTKTSSGDSNLLQQLKIIVNLFRKIKRNYDLINKRQRKQINNYNTKNTHLKIVVKSIIKLHR